MSQSACMDPNTTECVALDALRVAPGLALVVTHVMLMLFQRYICWLIDFFSVSTCVIEVFVWPAFAFDGKTELAKPRCCTYEYNLDVSPISWLALPFKFASLVTAGR